MVPVAAAAAPSLLTTLGPAIAGGAFGMMGAQMQTASSAKEANKQRAWQEAMANTAHQREVRDLRAAGLNPVLSTARQGAATPSGAMGQVADFAGAMSSGAQSGMAVKRLWRELQNMAAVQDKDETQAGLNTAQKYQSVATTTREEEQAKQLKDVQKLLQQQLETEKASTAREAAEAKLAQSQVPGAKIEADIDSGVQGEITRRIQRIMDAIPGLGTLLRGLKGSEGGAGAPRPSTRQRRLPRVP